MNKRFLVIIIFALLISSVMVSAALIKPKDIGNAIVDFVKGAFKKDLGADENFPVYVKGLALLLLWVLFYIAAGFAFHSHHAAIVSFLVALSFVVVIPVEFFISIMVQFATMVITVATVALVFGLFYGLHHFVEFHESKASHIFAAVAWFFSFSLFDSAIGPLIRNPQTVMATIQASGIKLTMPVTVMGPVPEAFAWVLSLLGVAQWVGLAYFVLPALKKGHEEHGEDVASKAGELWKWGKEKLETRAKTIGEESIAVAKNLTTHIKNIYDKFQTPPGTHPDAAGFLSYNQQLDNFIKDLEPLLTKLIKIIDKKSASYGHVVDAQSWLTALKKKRKEFGYTDPKKFDFATYDADRTHANPALQGLATNVLNAVDKIDKNDIKK